MSPAGPALVVGLGSIDRGDDAVGPAVARLVADAIEGALPRGARVLAHEDPTTLLDLLPGPDRHDGRDRTVIVVDAVRSGAVSGTVLVLDVGPGGADTPTMAAHLDPGPAGTHGFGLAGAIELARALGRLPARLYVVGVVAEQFEHGAGMSPAVGAALPRATATVLDLLARGPVAAGS